MGRRNNFIPLIFFSWIFIQTFQFFLSENWHQSGFLTSYPSLLKLKEKKGVNSEVLRYINRLSDYLFVLARQTNKRELLWVPLKKGWYHKMPIKNRIANYQNEMIKWRHHFHENPELAYEEVNTSKKVVSLLNQSYVLSLSTPRD